jgi:putative Mg2+ transporter-C (MgtC) family protein
MLGAVAYPTLSSGEMLFRLLVAGGLSLAIGLEREIHDRAAGLRTHLFVGLGAALFTLISAYGFYDVIAEGPAVVRTDPTRIAAQVVTGIGFLGAAAIIRSGLSVRGLTSAAGLWVVAAIGMAAAAGMFLVAGVTTVIVLLGLGPLRMFEREVVSRVRHDRCVFRIDLAEGASAWPVLGIIQEVGATVRTVELRDDEEQGHWLTVECDLPAGVAAARVGDRIAGDPSVSTVDW